MRSAAGLHPGDLNGGVEVRDVEDPDALEPRPDRGIRAAVDAATRLLHGHEQQVPVDRDLALAARADDGGAKRRVGGIGDVVDLEPVEVSDEREAPLEREVGVDEAEGSGIVRVGESGRLVAVSEKLEAGGGNARVVKPRTQTDARVSRRW